MSFDIISFIQDNIGTLAPSVNYVAGAVISAMFLRRKTGIETSTSEFQKIKAKKLGEVAEQLLDEGKISYTDFNKMKNYAAIAKKADELRQEGKIPKQDFDWHTRFFEACGNVSDEDMQQLWAKLLAGEIYHPGSSSLRTLECLRNLSKEEALLFQKVCKCSVSIGNSVAVPRMGDIMGKNGITYDDIIKLEDCGLLKSAVGMSIGMDVGNDYQMLTNDGQWVLLTKKKAGVEKYKKLEISEFLFTACGKEIFSVIGKGLDLQDFCKILQDERQDYEFALGQILENIDGRIRYALTSLKVEMNETE